VVAPADALSPGSEVSHPWFSRHRGGPRAVRVGRPVCSFRNQVVAARVRAATRDAALALAGGVACVGRDRVAGVALGSVRRQPVTARLLVRGRQLVRCSAGVAVPARVARQARCDVATAGSLADRVCRAPVRLAEWRAGVQAGSHLVLRSAA
jgi:hypothetical protein